jgi:hypothetical protein
MRHRVFVSSDGYASVMRDPRRVVWGLLWDLALANVPALDRYESLSSGLYTKVAQPVLTEKGARRAIVYIGRSTRPGIPKVGYMEEVLEAAIQANLPADYIRGLEAWLPHKKHEAPPAPERRPVRPLWNAPNSTLGKPRDIKT